MSNTKTVHVSHLGGIEAGYQLVPQKYDPSKPTLVLVNSFTTSSDLYRGQYANEKLTSTMNLLAIELLGHGKTRTKSENFTYWDTAIMNLQVMEALGVKKAFVLGTSQGGWITVRMALLAPDRVWAALCAFLLLTILKIMVDRLRASFHLARPWTTNLNALAPSAAGMVPLPLHLQYKPGLAKKKPLTMSLKTVSATF